MRLTENNPSITNLSDPNRPMKVGEQYSELYDNEWTDLMDKLEAEKKKTDHEDKVKLGCLPWGLVQINCRFQIKCS